MPNYKKQLLHIYYDADEHDLLTDLLLTFVDEHPGIYTISYGKTTDANDEVTQMQSRASRFFDYLDNAAETWADLIAECERTSGAPFGIYHTGGGCLVAQAVVHEHRIWVSYDTDPLPGKRDDEDRDSERFMVVLYAPDGSEYGDGESRQLIQAPAARFSEVGTAVSALVQLVNDHVAEHGEDTSPFNDPDFGESF